MKVKYLKTIPLVNVPKKVYRRIKMAYKLHKFPVASNRSKRK